MNPRQSSTAHTELVGDEASVYDWAHAQVHALNPTAARVWRLCDGETSPDAIAAALHRETGIPEADAVVDLTLKELARLHLLELPVESLKERPAPTRRWLLERGLTAALLPAVYTILTPSPLDAQSPGAPGSAPTLTSVAPNQGTQGTTVSVALTGTNFVAGATTVNVSGAGVTVNTVVVGSTTSLSANFVIDAAAGAGPRTVTVTTAGGTSGGQTFTINLPAPGAPTLTSVAPNQGIRGATLAVTLTGANFVVGATTVNISGDGLTANTVVVGSTTSLTANFVLDPAAAPGPRTVTVTTAGGTSGGQIFTINLAAPTLISVAPNQGVHGTTVVGVTLTGTNFVVGATTVAVSGAGVVINTIVVSNTTSLTANFVLDGSAALGIRQVTVTTAGGTSGAQNFTINPGSVTFSVPGGPQPFKVPPGVATLTVTARGARGGNGLVGNGGLGGSVTATLTVAPGADLKVHVGGLGGHMVLVVPPGVPGPSGAGGANGGGAGGGPGGTVSFAGGGGGSSDVRSVGGTLTDRLVVAGGGGGGGFPGAGGVGGGNTGGAGASSNPNNPPTVPGGSGGTQGAGGSGGVISAGNPLNGKAGNLGVGGAGGPSAEQGGGGGGGGYYGGGGGAVKTAGIDTGAAGGGGSSYVGPSATLVSSTQGDRDGNGEVIIGW